METSSIATLIIGLSAVVGLPLAAWSRKKNGRKQADELQRHLTAIGIKASLLPEFTDGEKEGKKQSWWGHKSVGTIKLSGRNIDSIDVVGQIHQYGVNYFLDYRVRQSVLINTEKKSKTKLHRKKDSAFRGKVVEIEWKGDESLSQQLNLDYGLKHQLMQSVPKGNIEILADPKRDYAVIRTGYILPAIEAFEILERIARHVRA